MSNTVNYERLTEFGKRVEMMREEFAAKERKNNVPKDKRCYSRDGICRALGVADKTYRLWIQEDGTAIDLMHLTLLCKHLDIDADYLMGRIDYKTHDNKWICEKTGLSEQTLVNLQRDPSMVYTINYIQTCSCANSLFKDIRDYIEAFPIPLSKGEEVQEVHIEYQDGDSEHFAFGVKDVYYEGVKITHETIRTTILYRIRDNLETIGKKMEYSLRMKVK